MIHKMMWKYIINIVAYINRLLSKMLPTPNRLPQSRSDARRYITSLHGLDYKKIHACVNDCILFRGDYENVEVCPKCGEDRYRKDVSGLNIPRKVLLIYIYYLIMSYICCPKVVFVYIGSTTLPNHSANSTYVSM